MTLLLDDPELSYISALLRELGGNRRIGWLILRDKTGASLQNGDLTFIKQKDAPWLRLDASQIRLVTPRESGILLRLTKELPETTEESCLRN